MKKPQDPIDQIHWKADQEQENDALRKFRERVKELIGQNVAEFARQLDLPRHTVYAYQQGRYPSFEFFWALQKINVSLDWLFTGKGEKYRGDEYTISRTEADPLLDLWARRIVGRELTEDEHYAFHGRYKGRKVVEASDIGAFILDIAQGSIGPAAIPKIDDPDLRELVEWALESAEVRGALVYLKEEKLRNLASKYLPGIRSKSRQEKTQPERRDLERNASKAG